MDMYLKNDVQFRYTVYDDPWQMIIFDSDNLYAVQKYIKTIVNDFDEDALDDIIIYDSEEDQKYSGQDILAK